MADYAPVTHDGACLFCKIVDGQIKTPGVFWEDDQFMAFLSLFPNTEGFSVVVPKDHYGSDVLAMPANVLTDFVLAAKTVSEILVAHFADVGRVGLIMEGTGIDHAHIKLYPMHGTGHMKTGEWKQHHSEVSTFFPVYPGYISSNDGPMGDEQHLAQLAAALRTYHP